MHFVLSKFLLYVLILRREIHKGLMVLTFLAPIKYLKPLLLQKTLLDATILLISIFFIEIYL